MIDLPERQVHAHRNHSPDGYGRPIVFGAEARVDALLIPGLTLRLDQLPGVGRG